MKKLSIVLATALGAIPTARARAGVPWYGSDAPTYTRTYSALHLKSHPNQQVRSITVTNGLSDLILPLPGEMNDYVGAELTGEIQLRDGLVLEVRWTCRPEVVAGQGQLACIPMNADLWRAMDYGTFAVFTPANSPAHVLPPVQFIRFPQKAAFRARDASVAGAPNEPVLLGSSISGPRGDTIFQLRVLPERWGD